MVFKREALKELRKRLSMSSNDVAFALSETSRLLGLDTSCTGATIRNYESGRTVPTVNILDSLEVLARYFGHEDVTFYEPSSFVKIKG